MNKKALVGIIVVLVILVAAFGIFQFSKTQKNPSSSTITPTPTQSQSKITFPKGGENLTKGQSYTLTWTGGGNQVQIFLIDTSLESQGESVSEVDKLYGISNSGSYDYKIPDDIKDGTYKFEIGTMTSKPFQIVSP
jgi:hypothetical protein